MIEDISLPVTPTATTSAISTPTPTVLPSMASATPQESSSLSWRSFNYGGKTHTFPQLEPDTFVFVRPDSKEAPSEKFTVDIRYTDHCFTRSPRPGEEYDLSQVWSMRTLGNGVKKVRLFCPMRNELSKLLPDLIRSFPDKKPHHNKEKRNFFTVDTLTYQGNPVKYDIIFSVRKSGKGRLELLVETAYVDEPDYPAAPLDGRRVRFWIILNNTLKGIKIPN
ncbi:hypothetical protein [Granulicella tundricola]|uniref:Uncharacterized protein n=1 Tax=Granulicella tundricola (strain ATCC BAA-1859 / DSM 23138 / MP5ACTX9) TaxID=1198114 RepID=E8X7M3_GRATM|nr:hypothetical protein [Granulicella tundricola]ADW71457.1 hypothetical protein AciX9_4516 [Granulicella tundricola MP5ACTX9]